MTHHQYSLQLIQHEVSHAIVQQRASDGYVHVTELCKQAGKKFNDYSRLASTQEFVIELSADTGIPVTELIQTVSGGVPGFQGTWLHPQAAIHFGQWLSPKFAVMVSKWVYDWMTGKAQQNSAQLPYHIRRHLANDSKVPFGFFSLLQESTFGLTGQMFQIGHEFKRGIVPDISIGLCFNRYLRDSHSVDTELFPMYWHDYLDGRVVEAKLYPNEYLALFRHWFHTVWLTEKAPTYLKKKDPDSLQYLDKLPALAAPKTTKPASLAWRSQP
jgi:hypothetical protein